jgi:hypothetical protein
MSTETPVPSPKPAPARSSSQLPGLLVLLATTAAGGYLLYTAYAAQAQFNHQLVEVNQALEARITELEGAIASAPGSDVLNAMQSELADRKQQISTLESRLATIEKTTSAPAPVIEVTPPPAGNKETLQQFLSLKQAVEQGVPYAKPLAQLTALPELKDILKALDAHAQTGVATDTALRDELARLLEQQTATEQPDAPEYKDINDTLRGLLRISRKKPAAPTDPLTSLRAQTENGASLDVLITAVGSLSESTKASFQLWLEKAKARQAALASLKAAETQLTQPAA